MHLWKRRCTAAFATWDLLEPSQSQFLCWVLQTNAEKIQRIKQEKIRHQFALPYQDANICKYLIQILAPQSWEEAGLGAMGAEDGY